MSKPTPDEVLAQYDATKDNHRYGELQRKTVEALHEAIRQRDTYKNALAVEKDQRECDRLVLTSERDRYRAALREIAEGPEITDYEWCIRLAKATLHQSEDK